MFLTGYPPEDLLLRDDLYLSLDTALEKLAKHSPDLNVVIGYPRKKNKNIYNAAGLLYEGEIKTEYFKQELPNYKVFDEKRYFSPGKNPCLITVKGTVLALTICEDIWYTKAIRQATRRGAELILNLNASPFHRYKLEERKSLLIKHAEKFSVPIIYVNQVGGQDELVFDGSSLVVSPGTGIDFQLPSFKTATATLDFCNKDGTFQIINKKKVAESSDLKNLYDAIVLGTHDYIEKNGFSGALIGSSGGIDSALTTAIAVDALGAGRVKTVMMPFKYTSNMSIEDAEQLSDNLKVQHEVIEIKGIYDSFEKSLKKEFKGKKKDKTVLMAMSNKSGYLVLTTGNKSETAVGYSTLYGDTAGGFAVLKDVPKTWVYELANYRNSISRVIPQRIIERPPSAELAPNQKDSDSLPDYKILDAIIELYVEKDMSAIAIANKGFDEVTVKRVVNLINKSEYKRRQAPPGVRITDRGFGKDRRYPITNKYSQ